MDYDNEIKIIMSSKSQNEAFARIAAAAFASQADPLVADITEIKTAVSEAVTNSIIHGYDGVENGEIILTLKLKDDEFCVEISDAGRGIENIEEAMQPMFTSKPEMERSGMGFTVMETFMDYIKVTSKKDKGTNVIMKKKLSRHAPPSDIF